MAGCDVVFHLAANADVRFGTEHPAEGSRAEHDRHLQRARGHARQRHQADRLLLHRLGLRRGARLPHARRRAVPGADLALRRLQAGRRGADRGLLRRASASKATSSASSRSSASATPTATSSTSTGISRKDPTRLTVLGNGKQRKSYLYVGTASTRCCWRWRRRAAPSRSSTSAPTSTVEVNDSIGWICERLGLTPALEYTGGDRGWIGDNPFIFLDTAKIRGARLDAEADHPRGHHPDARVPAAEPGAARGARMKVASWGSGTSARSRPPASPPPVTTSSARLRRRPRSPG